MSSYIAVGVFHHYLITDDLGFLKRMWSTLRAGVDYAVSMQAPTEKFTGRGTAKAWWIHGSFDGLQLHLHEHQMRLGHRVASGRSCSDWEKRWKSWVMRFDTGRTGLI